MEPEETRSPEPPAEQIALEVAPAPPSDAQLQAVVEAIVYVAEEPVTAAQIAAVVGQPEDAVRRALAHLAEESAAAHRGVAVREVAGGYKMGTKPEHHEVVRAFAKSLKPPLKLSLAALETLAVIAYKQPITAPEVLEIRGVQGAGVLKTLLERKLITTCGRKNVIGRPMLYRTTKEFLLHFGLKDLSELPTLKEFEDLRRLALGEEQAAAEAPLEGAPAEGPAAPEEASAEEPPPPEEAQAEGPAAPESAPAEPEEAQAETPAPPEENA